MASRPPPDPDYDPLIDDRPPHPKPWERGVSVDEAVTWMIADEAGLDGRTLARAGLEAQPVLRRLREAARAKSAKRRARLSAETRAALADLGKDAPAELVRQVTARLDALDGRQDAEPCAQPESHAGPQTGVNPDTGLQEFTIMPVDRPPAPNLFDRLKGWLTGQNGRTDGGFRTPGIAGPWGPRPSGNLLSPAAQETDGADGGPRWPPPVPGHKPDPNMSDVEKSRSESDADALRQISGSLKTFGAEQSSESLNRFLSGSGRDRFIDPEIARSWDTVKIKEEKNRNKYRESTFGDWKPQTPKGHQEKAKLDAIHDGETINLEDRWISDFYPEDELSPVDPKKLKQMDLEWTGVDPDLFASIGSGKLITDGDFTVTRNGNVLSVTGDVVHDLDDRYDFIQKPVASFADIAKTNDLNNRAFRLQESGYAQPFRNRSRWSQPMKATVIIGPDGQRRVKEIHWGDVAPYQWSEEDYDG